VVADRRETPMPSPPRFDNSYARLPERFAARTRPTPVRAPALIRVNRRFAEAIGIDPDWLASPEGIETAAGNRVPDGAEPLAMAYAGHQFGQFVPQLGDGRAILLGEVVGPDGGRRDIHLKGAGRTPFSRGGDGRAALGPVLREYVVSEAMAGLGIPTTRALMAVTTGERVLREEVLPGAVFARVAASHVRVGTFQYFAARGDTAAIRTLVDHVIARHHPQAAAEERPALALLSSVAERQARLVAAWMSVGFVHGVMNTDNMTVSGETIDYGPCAFVDTYHPATVFSSIDRQGRYAFANQPRIAQWNLARLAETLLPLIADDEDAAVGAAEDVLADFATAFETAFLDRLRAKLGLLAPMDGDGEIARDFLAALAAGQGDFTLAFRRLADAAEDPAADGRVRATFADPAPFDDWAPRWRARLSAEPATESAERAAAMRRANPAVIARNHRVEAVIRAAEDHGDLGPFETLLSVLENPFEGRPDQTPFETPPEPHERVTRTFCGT
jgi:uncharacterized protein YdiU (UPF0061 family)